MAAAEGFGDAFVVGRFTGWVLPFGLGGEGHEDAQRVGLREILAFGEGVAAFLARGGEADGAVALDFDGDLVPCQAVAGVKHGFELGVRGAAGRGDDGEGSAGGFLGFQ